MDVDGDRSFSSSDLEKLENADEVSTNYRKRTNQLGVCTYYGAGKVSSDRRTEYEMRLKNGKYLP